MSTVDIGIETRLTFDSFVAYFNGTVLNEFFPIKMRETLCGCVEELEGEDTRRLRTPPDPADVPPRQLQDIHASSLSDLGPGFIMGLVELRG